MALLTFPNAPVNGQLYPVTPVVGQNQYRYDSATSTWVLLGAATAVIPGTYGSGTEVAQFTVDTQGRLTFAQNVPIASGAGGTVTQVDTGTGLSGGPITGTGTVTLDTTYTDTLYLQLAGGTMTGDITFSGTQTFPAQDLDEVTTAGNTTANTIDVAGLVASGLSYPSADGALGDVLVTDGAGNLGFVTPPVEDLDTVTTAGNTTTNSIDVGALIASGLTYPVADGVVGDVLVTDGAGALSFVTPPVEDLDSVTTAGNTTVNTIDVGGLVAAGLNYPVTDGTADQVLATDGAGTLGWLTTLKVVAPPTASTDPGNPGEVSAAPGFFYFYDGTQWLQVAGSVF
jgi:hypothetical protein